MGIVSLSDCRIFYQRLGEGKPALLFVHGAFCDHRDWAAQMRDLQDDLTVVAIDQRGHGQSVADGHTATVDQLARDVHDLIDALDLGPTIAVGHSLGARVVIQAAADRPDHLLGAVLVDGSRIGPKPQRGDEAPPSDDGGGELVQAFAAMFTDRIDPADRQRVMDNLAATPRDVAQTVRNSAAAWDVDGVEVALAAIPATLPVLAVQSTFFDDAQKRHILGAIDTTSSWLELLKSYLPQLEVVILPDVGHFAMLEAADEVTRAIRTFAQRVREAASRRGGAHPSC